MSIRALQARIVCDRATLDRLWRTHQVFHERLPHILGWLFKMRRGECGDTEEKRRLYQTIGRFMTKSRSQSADYLMNAVSIKDWTPNTARRLRVKTENENGEAREISGEDWADAAAELSARGELLFDKRAVLGDLPSCMQQMLNREAVAIIRGHDELLDNWTAQHAHWLNEKEKWESDEEHKKYLRLRPSFDAFESSVAGKIGKRRGRWRLYLDWLRANPGLAAWRGGPAVVHPISQEAEARIRKAKPWKTASIEAEEFWKANPELAALDKLHGYYERTFVRRRKTKRNPDGFDHRPTFTMPHPVNHPRWFVFNAPQTNPQGYRKLHLPENPGELGSIELRLLTGDRVCSGSFPSDWVELRFRADPRLSRIRRIVVSKRIVRGQRKGKTKEVEGYEFEDRHLGIWRRAELSGVKLIFRDVRLDAVGALRSATPYLVFACTVEDLPLTEKAQEIEWTESEQITKSGKKKVSRTLPDGMTACAVDLGLRNVGFATLCRYENGECRVLRARNIWIEEDRAGPDLVRIAQHKREIRRLRRLRGKPVKGENSHVALQKHITQMGEDRFKKAARAILNFAWNVDGAVHKKSGTPIPRADVIVLERLAGFIPDAERERGINRSLAAWNRGQLVARLKVMAEDAGYKRRVFEVRPAGTSQVCSKCGRLGRRYSIRREPGSTRAVVRFGWVEKLFACSCGFCANADYNASVNLHRKFLLGDNAVRGFYIWKNLTEPERTKALEELEAVLRELLSRKHKLVRPDVASATAACIE